MTLQEKRVRANAIKRIQELKISLAETDYEAIKYAEGEMLYAEYASVKEQRKAWRKEINELEAIVNK